MITGKPLEGCRKAEQLQRITISCYSDHWAFVRLIRQVTTFHRKNGSADRTVMARCQSRSRLGPVQLAATWRGTTSEPWCDERQDYALPISLQRLFTNEILQKLDARSSLIAGALATLLIVTAPEEFGIPECTTTIEAAGLSGAHRWGNILPNSSRVSMLTYRAIVAVRYPELVLQDGNYTNIGHFVPHEATVMQGGFRIVLWTAAKDLRLAVEDVVTFCNYLRNCYPSLRQGVTSAGSR